jgi:hypothetical protein
MRRGPFLRRQLRQRHPHRQHDQRPPLRRRDAFPQHQHRKHRCRQNLHLVPHLERGRVQVRQGVVQQVVLHRVQQRRHRQLDDFHRVLQQFLTDRRRKRGHRPFFVRHDQHTRHELDQLHHRHGRRRRVQRPAVLPGITHEHHEKRVLQDQQRQRPVLETEEVLERGRHVEDLGVG